MGHSNLVAACGLYCGACEMYRADHDNNIRKLGNLAQGLSEKTGQNFTPDECCCDGCLGHGSLNSWCAKCQIRLCEKIQTGKTRCSECNDFPCSRLSSFSNDGMPHHLEILDNLRQIQNIGIQAWIAQEEERWACPECHSTLSWYDTVCPSCKAPRSKRLFSLPLK